MAQHTSDKDIQKLLEIAESSSEPVKFEDTDVELYIRECAIEAGETLIPTYMIYHNYVIWCRNVSKKPYTRNKFFRQFRKHFEFKKTSNGNEYFLNPDEFDLSQQGYFRARALLRKERDAQKKAKAEKKQS